MPRISAPSTPPPSNHDCLAVCNGDVCDFVFEGNGAVNIMGPVTVTIMSWRTTAAIPATPTPPETTFVGATGSITISDTAGWVCPSPGRGKIQGIWNVAGGTGQFSGIVGSGADRGTFSGNGPNCTLDRDRKCIMPNCMQQFLKPTG